MISSFLMLGYFGLFSSILFALIRLVKGPSILDRLIAFDSIALSSIGMIILFSMQTSTFYSLEMLLIFSLLGFTTVLGYMDYLSQKEKEGQENEFE